MLKIENSGCTDDGSGWRANQIFQEAVVSAVSILFNIQGAWK
jgi:hypothetical protein